MQFDVIVVGGGSAGCAMAARLSEDGRLNVLLLEAGTSDKHGVTKIPAMMTAAMQNPEFDWRFRAEPDPSLRDRVDIWPAGKCLGGGGAINGMAYIRGLPSDYDRWAKEGATGWDYVSVLPVLKRIEHNERGADDYRGGEGPLRVAEGRDHSHLVDEWIEAAVDGGVFRSPDLNGAHSEGVDFVQVTQKNGVRQSAAVYLEGALKRKNLQLIANAQVTRIRFDGRRAVGVDYMLHGQPYAIDAARGVVVCGGAINSPKLLLQSGLGPAAHLREMGVDVVADLPGVGENLQDHPGAQMVHDVNVPTLNTDARGLGALKQALTFGLSRKGLLAASLGHAHAFLRTRDGLDAPNVHLIFSAYALDFDKDGTLTMRKQASISTFAHVCHPRARGHVRLRSPDPLDAPVIQHAVLGDTDDMEMLVEAMECARFIAGRAPLSARISGEVRPGWASSNKEGLRDFLRQYATASYDVAGTCKIGADAMAVVDHTLKVRGVEGLWVADASVMPSLVAGGANATAIMIGEKGADLVKAALTA
jgi:choline dehydrogenase-like flavoprotein